MKFTSGLVLAAVAVTAANAHNFRSTKEETYDDHRPIGQLDDEDFVVDLTDLFGSESMSGSDTKINILDLIGSGSDQIPLEDIIEAFGGSGFLDSYDMPEDDYVNVKGGKNGMHHYHDHNDRWDSWDQSEDAVNVKGGKHGVPVDESYVNDDLHSDSDNWDHWDQSEDAVNVKGGKHGVPVDESYVNDDLHSDSDNWDHWDQSEDAVNVKGGKHGVPVVESYEKDDLHRDSTGKVDIHRVIEDFFLSSGSGHKSTPETVDAFLEVNESDPVFGSNSESDSCDSKDDDDYEIEDTVNVKGGKLSHSNEEQPNSSSDYFYLSSKHLNPEDEDIVNVKGGKYGASVKKNSDDISDDLDSEQQYDVDADTQATKNVKSSGDVAPHINNLFDDSSKGFLDESDDEDVDHVKKHHEKHMNYTDEDVVQNPIQSDEVNTKISEPFY